MTYGSFLKGPRLEEMLHQVITLNAFVWPWLMGVMGHKVDNGNIIVIIVELDSTHYGYHTQLQLFKDISCSVNENIRTAMKPSS